MKDQDGNELDIEDVFEDSDSFAVTLARIDERTKKTNEIIERVIEKRIDPLEDQVDGIDNRSRRNEVVLSAMVTTITIVGAWSLNLLPV